MLIERPEADADQLPDPALEAIAMAILDGAPIDWQKTSHDPDPALLHQLQILSGLTTVHRTLTPGSGGGSLQEEEDLTPVQGVSWGPLTLRERIGRGAFGEVYRAWDPRLDREVALKLLRRVESRQDSVGSVVIEEGRLLARLRHPNVVTVYGADRIDGRVGLWMEFVQGRTLEVVLRDHGPFGAQEATLIGLDLCRALSAVHGAGVIHRDVKAQNVMREAGGRIVLMDFGTGREALADRPVELAGTPLYLAPEVFGGAQATAESDIYSVGVLLFHLVTGSYPTKGRTVAEIREAHGKQHRSWLRNARPDLPDAFVQAVERALEFDPDERYDSAGAMEAALARVVSSTDAATSQPAAAPIVQAPPVDTRRSRSLVRLAWAAGAVLTLAVALAALVMPATWRDMMLIRTPPEPAKLTFELETPLSPSPNHLALSPDGTRVAAIVGSERMLWLRAMDRLDSTILIGTEGATSPFWSPDGRSIAFFANNRLKKVDIAGGAPQTIAEGGGGRSFGGAWSRDDVILFGGATGQLFRVAASGGESVPVTELDPARQEVSHRHPQFLPDGVHFLFLAIAAKADDSGIYVGSLDSTSRRRLLGASVKAMFASSGHLLFMRDNTLMAQRFDPARLELAGDPLHVTDDVGQFVSNGAAGFTVSRNGLLAYRSAYLNDTVLTWFDRSGKPIGTLGEPARHGGVQLSHEGTRAAVPIVDKTLGTHDIWLYDVALANRTQFTFDPGDETTPIWSHDDSRIVFSSQRDSPFPRLEVKQANGTGGEELLLENPSNLYPSDWSVDGRSMLYVSGFTAGSTDTLWVLPFAGDRKPQRFAWSTAPRFLSWAYFSPDGRWVAYSSSESGRSEIYVVPSDGSAGKWRISRAEGAMPRWRRDGREIYYLEGMSRLMAAAVDGRDAAFHVGAVSELFSFDALATGARPYDVMPDGQRFLVNARQAGARQAPVTIVVNWASGLGR